jgi:hypothetical protein
MLGPEILRPGTIPGSPVPTTPVASRARARSRPRAGFVDRTDVLLFGGSVVAYLVVGGLLVFGYGSVPVDTWARVGNAYYVLFSRDPHLAAIGFVLSPVPTLAILPLLPFKVVAPALVSSAFAANVVSAVFTGGTLLLFRRMTRTLRVPRVGAAVLVAAVALHPMTVYYAANGLTEAPFVFSLAWVALALLRWLDRGLVRDLAWLGLGLGFAYLTRYEAIAAALAVIAVVLVVSWLRSPGSRGGRSEAAASDAVVVAAPFVAAFAGWAFVSWLIVGVPFAHFSSIYGNASQAEVLRPFVEAQTGQGTSAAFEYVGRQVLGLAPVLPFVALLAIVRAIIRRDVRILATVAFAAPLAASVVLFLSGSTVGFLRYYIAAVPLAALLAAHLLARGRGTLSVFGAPVTEPLDAGARGRPRPFGIIGRRVAGGAVAIVTLAALTAGLLTALPTLRHPLLAREEADALRTALGNDPATDQPSYVLATGADGASVAGYLDGLDAPRGSILIDVAIGNAVVLQSRHPERWVITTDRDFDAAVEDPVTWGIRYLVVPEPNGEGRLDALNRRYPLLYETGEAMATELVTFDRPAGAHWKVFAVNDTRQ